MTNSIAYEFNIRVQGTKTDVQGTNTVEEITMQELDGQLLGTDGKMVLEIVGIY
jgi:hypothetical protein